MDVPLRYGLLYSVTCVDLLIYIRTGTPFLFQFRFSLVSGRATIFIRLYKYKFMYIFIASSYIQHIFMYININIYMWSKIHLITLVKYFITTRWELLLQQNTSMHKWLGFPMMVSSAPFQSPLLQPSRNYTYVFYPLPITHSVKRMF